MSLNTEQVLKANADFSASLYEVLSKDTENLVYSPLSAHAILSLTAQGAAGETEKCLKRVLNLPDPKQTTEGYKAVIEATRNMKETTVHFANKVYVMDGYKTKDSFRSVAEKCFCSEVQQVDFKDNVNTARTINSWVEEKTEEKIKDLVKSESLDGATRMVLVNALYFKGFWDNYFEESFTKKRPFYLNENDLVEVDMMRTTDRFYYKNDKELEAEILEIPYKDSEAGFVVILPNARNGLAELERKLAKTNLTQITQNAIASRFELSLPKFKIESRIELSDTLKELGLEIIFNEEANFSGLLESPEPLVVSEVVQKVFIEVNEWGTEASAATYLQLCLRSRPSEFVVDHPFVFLLVSRCNNSLNILFQGRVVLPKY